MQVCGWAYHLENSGNFATAPPEQYFPLAPPSHAYGYTYSTTTTTGTSILLKSIQTMSKDRKSAVTHEFTENRCVEMATSIVNCMQKISRIKNIWVKDFHGFHSSTSNCLLSYISHMAANGLSGPIPRPVERTTFNLLAISSPNVDFTNNIRRTNLCCICHWQSTNRKTTAEASPSHAVPPKSAGTFTPWISSFTCVLSFYKTKGELSLTWSSNH